MNRDLVELAAKLTAKQRAFVNELVAGTEQSEAYRRAYNKPGRMGKDIAANACHVKNYPHVKAYLLALIAEQEHKRFMTRERKRQKLAEIVDDHDAKTSDQIKAIEVDNKMTGDEAPVKTTGDLVIRWEQ